MTSMTMTQSQNPFTFVRIYSQYRNHTDIDIKLDGYRPDSTSGKTFASGTATVATLIVWALAQSRGDGHRSLVTPEKGIKRV